MQLVECARVGVIRATLALVVAVAGAALAVAATDGGSDGAALVTATGGFATVPESTTLPPPSEDGAGATSRTGLQARTGGRSRLPRFHRRADAVSPSRERRKPANAGSRRWESSTPRSTPACIRVTGSSSRGSTDPRPRRRAICSLHAGSPARRPCVESFHDVARALSGSATGKPDFVDSTKRRYTPPCGASKQSIFRPLRAILRGAGAFNGRSPRTATGVHVSILACDLSLDQVTDRPYADTRTRLAYRRDVLWSASRPWNGWRGPALLRPSRPGAVPGHPPLLPDHCTGQGGLDRTEGVGAVRRSSTRRSRRALSTAVSHAAVQPLARARRASGHRSPAATLPSHQHLERRSRSPE